jgi:hypothetical protein
VGAELVARRVGSTYDGHEEVTIMPLPPSTEEVEEMVRTKLRYQHSELYKQLLSSGQLDAVAKERANVFDQTYSQVEGELKRPVLAEEGENKDWSKKVANLDRARDQATEQALAAALEFPEDESADFVAE